MWQDIESVLHPGPTSSNNELVSDRHGLAHTENGGHLSDFTDFSNRAGSSSGEATASYYSYDLGTASTPSASAHSRYGIK